MHNNVSLICIYQKINNNGPTYIAHFTNVSMRFTTSGGLFRAAYYIKIVGKINEDKSIQNVK
jgi:hypothetical protein